MSLASGAGKKGKFAVKKELCAPAGMRGILQNKGVRDDHLLVWYGKNASSDKHTRSFNATFVSAHSFSEVDYAEQKGIVLMGSALQRVKAIFAHGSLSFMVLPEFCFWKQKPAVGNRDKFSYEDWRIDELIIPD
eukprot:833984-Pelagomonas_calceolata.AAC.1